MFKVSLELGGWNLELQHPDPPNRQRTSFLRGGECHICRHAGAEIAVFIVEADFHAEDLLQAFPGGLHVARRELGGAADLLDVARKVPVGERIDSHANCQPDPDFSQPRFGHEDAHP